LILFFPCNSFLLGGVEDSIQALDVEPVIAETVEYVESLDDYRARELVSEGSLVRKEQN
jgi:hypothetical protein